LDSDSNVRSPADPVDGGARARAAHLGAFKAKIAMSCRLLSRQHGIAMRVRELLHGVIVDEPLVEQPLDGPSIRSSLPPGVPRRDEVWMVLVDLVAKSA
jgi:hypothetical protein